MQSLAHFRNYDLAAGGAALAACVFLASCSSDNAGGGASEHAADHREQPTIVSLNPCLDAILVEVAAPDQILALSHYSRDPASSSIPAETAQNFAITGGTAEEVFALQPDIVLASTFIAPSTLTALEGLGLKVETFGSPASIEDSIVQVERVGALTGGGDNAAALVARINDATSRPTGGGDVSLMLWQPGQIVPGEGTLIAQVLSRNGFDSHSANLGLSQADYVSLERVLADPPEVLLVAGNSAGQTHPLLDQLIGTAVETFDPHLLYCGGPTIIEAAARIAEIRKSIR
uniref:ABC transporter substrate-binding protein n=1 Tax=uncultured Erythrobacter sp. TaxID=263913 RepID=UPI00261E2524|nr:ABC transporter substrate-binding protein [uncultured Erythrobacter sp.]